MKTKPFPVLLSLLARPMRCRTAAALLGIGLLTTAAGLGDTLSDARARFTDGEYDKAAKLFEQSLDSGTPSAGVYFELGRTFSKMGRESRAALNFQRALVLDPRFSPAANALRETNTALGIAQPAANWKQKILARIPMDLLAIGGACLFWAGSFFGLVSLIRLRPLRVVCSVLTTGLGLSLLALTWQCDPRITFRTEAMVLRTGGTDFLSSPTDQSEKLAALPEGTLVKILSQRGRWFYGQLPGGPRGWFLTEGIIPLIPPA